MQRKKQWNENLHLHGKFRLRDHHLLTQISCGTTAMKLWNHLRYICYIMGIQTKPKTQTTKLDNVYMLFVTGHEKILNKCYWAPNKNSYVGSCLNYFQKENLIKIIL